MAKIAKEYREKLPELKKMVETSYNYFDENYKRFHDFVKFVFDSSLTVEDLQNLRSLGKPTIEFNILESMISRLRGEFAKQQPSLSVRAADGVPIHRINADFKKTMEVIEDHLRSIFFDATNDSLEYNIYSDLLAGGFSVAEVYTDYVNEMSMEQNIYVSRVFDPTLCGFDPLARASHKGDGRYCFQIYPKTIEQFKEEFGSKYTENMKYSKNIDGFGWSYRDEIETFVLVCDLYLKKRTKSYIVKLSNGETIPENDYPAFQEEWEKSGNAEQCPIIINRRKTTFETICRYRFCETDVLDYVETNYKYLPLVFIDGNSVMVTVGDDQSQMTRPYVYHAMGAQKLKNFAGQTLANELENLVQHKFVVALESIPEKYKEAYNNVQKASTLVYKHFLDRNSPEITLPPPREVQRTPIPPEVTNTFKMTDDLTQVILGSYDSVMGIQNQQVSGAAVAMSSMQSNNASVPYIIGYIKGLNRIGQIILDLIPKYYRTPRSLPVLRGNGKRDYVIINKKSPESIYMNYDPNSMDVKVEAGVNFSMQKEMALKTLIGLMNSSPTFAKFMNTKGLPVLLDNIDIRGIDAIKSDAEEFMIQEAQAESQSAQMQQQIAQMQMQMNNQALQIQMQRDQAEAMKAMKEAQSPSRTQVDLIKMQQETKYKEIEASQNQQKIDISLAEFLAKIESMEAEDLARMAQIDAESARTAMEALKSLSGMMGYHSEEE